MNYPNGVRRNSSFSSGTYTQKNRGMSLEEDINITNQFYLETNRAVIHKKPTPVQVVQVKYPKRSAAVITEAYFQKPSTTDYNGIYREKYIDFEAKQTKSKTSFPLQNFHAHQIEHMESIMKHGGISFVIIRFTAHDETYFLDAKSLLNYWHDQINGGRKSIRYDVIQKEGYLIPFQYQIRVDYLAVIDQLYF